MRGEDIQQDSLLSYSSLEGRGPADHPLRPIRVMVDEVLKEMDTRFDAIYDADSRKSILPERLLRALLLQMLYSVRGERMLMEQLPYNLLFRWFVRLSMDNAVWHPTVFTKNRDRLLAEMVAEEFFRLILKQAQRKRLLSSEHLTVDGTLIEAWAGQKSFQPRDHDILKPSLPPDPGSNPAIDYHKQKRSNKTHQSTTNPCPRLFKKSKGAGAKLCYLGHLMTENRNGLVVNTRPTLASGTAERDAAVEMAREIPGGSKYVMLGAGRGYGSGGFVQSLGDLNVIPHVVQHTNGRSSAIGERTTRHEGYAMSQKVRKRVEEVFGWIKTVALPHQTKFRGPDKVGWMFTFAAAACNLVPMRNLLAQSD